MKGHHHKPKLRHPLEIRRERLNGQDIIVLQCPLGITEAPLALLPAAGPLLGAFTGELSFEEILEQSNKMGYTREHLEGLLSLLDEHYFLESEQFHHLRDTFQRSYFSKPSRAASLAGICYSSAPERLAQELQESLNEGSSPTKEACPHGTHLAVLKSPHIDYTRGGTVYGDAYNALQNQHHDLYILLGTSHQFSSELFHCTKKHFTTPLGTLECDTEFVETLAALYGPSRAYKDEYLHAKEHSLELQAPYLRYLTPKVKIAPILVGGFHQFLNDQQEPEQYDAYESFVGALSECLKNLLRHGGRFGFIAGVDMAHIGQHFGDKEPLTPSFLREIHQRDQEYLSCISRGSKQMLLEHIIEDGDARRICGWPTMYVILDVMERLQAPFSSELYSYRQAVDYDNDCAVTFAAMGLYSDHCVGISTL